MIFGAVDDFGSDRPAVFVLTQIRGDGNPLPSDHVTICPFLPFFHHFTVTQRTVHNDLDDEMLKKLRAVLLSRARGCDFHPPTCWSSPRRQLSRMKTLTRSVKNRIYTITVNLETNDASIHRGREGLSDTRPIFNADGVFRWNGGEIRKTADGYRDIYGVISAEDVERTVADAVISVAQKLEKRIQKAN